MSTATQPFKITKPLVTKLLSVVDAGLCSGKGRPEPGFMCIEAAVCYALDLPHSDDPPCVSPAVRAVKIALNDSEWSSKAARAKGMRRLAVAQLGTKDVINDAEFAKKLAEKTIRLMVPRALRIVAPLIPAHADKLEAAAVRCEADGNCDAASDASCAASAARAARAARAASYAASDAARAARAARAASDAASCAASDAASCAASCAASAARAASYAASDASAKARDRELAFFADLVLEVLIALKAPGAKWVKYCEAA
jgi:hypothetical protein